MRVVMSERLKLFKVGDEIRFLSEYNLLHGTVISIGRKNIKISYNNHMNYYNPNDVRMLTKKPEQLALLNEPMCVVWEQWKGVNGRGAYRLEFNLYTQHHLLGKNYPRQRQWVYESAYGVCTRMF